MVVHYSCNSCVSTDYTAESIKSMPKKSWRMVVNKNIYSRKLQQFALNRKDKLTITMLGLLIDWMVNTLKKCKYHKRVQLRPATKTHWVHPDKRLPVLGVADVNQAIQFSWTDTVRNKLDICQGILYTSFLCTENHSTEVSIDNVWTKTFELRDQLHTTYEQQSVLRVLHTTQSIYNLRLITIRIRHSSVDIIYCHRYK